ncbi:MAG: aldo/keto reductase [Rhizobiaceae bacterium]
MSQQTPTKPARVAISPELEISQVVTGLWQVADMERDGKTLDPVTAADDLQRYVEAGFDTFDMADHYGSAEIITGYLMKRDLTQRPAAMTKWCPPPGPMTPEIVRAGVTERLERLDVERIDLLQFHWWTFEHPQWLDALAEMNRLREEGLIGELGVTNFDAAHFNLAIADGVPLRTNQVGFSLIDRRAAGAMAETCQKHDARLLAYGTLCGGFISERWLGQKEPDGIADWSKMKYKRFIDAAGGWDVFQAILEAAKKVADRHGVSIPNVATRWVLEQPQVAAIIIGARLGENFHAKDNLRLFSFHLDENDLSLLDTAFVGTKPIPGDCGDEYRTPPFLTASGDLSHHLADLPPAFQKVRAKGKAEVDQILTGSKWEDLAGYCRAQRIGDRILVSGTTAIHGKDRAVAPGDAGAQTTYVLDRIISTVTSLGGKVEDIERTRIYITDEADVMDVSKAHGRVFGELKPANTLVRVAGLIGCHRVEIEAEAIVRDNRCTPNSDELRM